MQNDQTQDKTSVSKSNKTLSSKATSPTTSATKNMEGSEMIHAQLMEMVTFAVERGKQLPLTIGLEPTDDEKELLSSFNTIATAVAPATLQSIRFINSKILHHPSGKHRFSLPIFTRCIVITTIALLTLIGVSLLPSVNEANLAKGLLSSSGWILLGNLTFICAASLLGVMFYLLKTFSDKIKNYTLLPSDIFELNAIILIGIISGFITSELFTFKTGFLGSSVALHKMTLALLGGFSSDGIFTFLKGLVKKLKQLSGPGA